jgi:hypothetical protein
MVLWRYYHWPASHVLAQNATASPKGRFFISLAHDWAADLAVHHRAALELAIVAAMRVKSPMASLWR